MPPQRQETPAQKLARKERYIAHEIEFNKIYSALEKKQPTSGLDWVNKRCQCSKLAK